MRQDYCPRGRQGVLLLIILFYYFYFILGCVFFNKMHYTRVLRYTLLFMVASRYVIYLYNLV